jgi:hypothetical protein
VSTAAPCGRMFAYHGECGGGQLWAARYVRAATGSLVDGFQPRIRELLRLFPRMPATANRGADRASRSDSLIEFVKTNVAILPLLILTMS